LQAALALDRLGHLDAARLELDTLARDKRYSQEKPYVYLEAARMLLGHQLYGDALVQFGLLEKYLEPVDAVAEGMLLDGKDAQFRRVDYEEAMRLYEISAKVGPATEYGKKARDLADALADLLRLRKQTPADSAWADWTFSLAELHLLRLDNADSAKAAYGRILTHPGVPLEERARASYAIAWIDEGRDSSGTVPSPAWKAVIDSFPGTEFAKQAQKNGGFPVTTVTREDSAETVYRAAEGLWDTVPSDPKAADSAFRKLALEWRGTEAGKRARYACGWIEENLLDDTAAAKASYRWVVDSLPNTPWARKAAALLEALKTGPERIEFRKHDDFVDGKNGDGEPDFEEGKEKVEGKPVAPKVRPMGPVKPKPPTLQMPDEPDAVPPSPEGSYLSPDDFQ
jgi:tetratricopeptide (TPR) repeat protein